MPPDWRDFLNLWIAFNALYGGERDERERARAMSAMRRHMSAKDARHLLELHAASIAQIIDVPPGDMRLDRSSPRFRAASERCVRIARSPRETAPGRLAGVTGMLYQVRCNVFHASKDPADRRDRMVVRESLAILRDLVPTLERAVLAR
jgi:hypothetical protein